ncbi:MAG: putative DNA modification/repair radical SAM protein, partial [Clostridiales bacterium]|nr:putative DNA modification/repair radical SAM protein [Clostridiales bacterium]
MDLMQKLTILTDSAKYDVACTSSGTERPGYTVAAGCCHSFAADGRCISLLKILMSNCCVYHCKYCVNSADNDVPRASLSPDELAELTVQFYRRNYIEGLFLSSGIIKSPDHTTELMVKALEILRYKYDFWGYVHAKVIPGTSPQLIYRLGLLADRLSVNIELPSERSLALLAPGKSKEAILSPMRQIKSELSANALVKSGNLPALRKKAPSFAAAGQATQMIVGASGESDHQIINLASALYEKFSLKRVFYSAYIPVVENSLLPALATPPPLLREHRLYQADWLMRQYGFAVGEILSEEAPNFNPYLDPKCNWALNNMHFFPLDVNRAPLNDLLRVPGIGPVSARRIVSARRAGRLGTDELKRLGVVLKRAKYFIICKDAPCGPRLDKERTVRALIDPKVFSFGAEQLSLFEPGAGLTALPGGRD